MALQQKWSHPPVLASLLRELHLDIRVFGVQAAYALHMALASLNLQFNASQCKQYQDKARVREKLWPTLTELLQGYHPHIAFYLCC